MVGIGLKFKKLLKQDLSLKYAPMPKNSSLKYESKILMLLLAGKIILKRKRVFWNMIIILLYKEKKLILNDLKKDILKQKTIRSENKFENKFMMK
jgi:hypothetical protein